MIGYITLGTNDLTRAVAYYDSLFESIGITTPYNKEEATVGNGVMIALVVDSPEKVSALYKKALELGGTDEGKPGFRPEDTDKGFYCAYFRDLDGNKLNVFCMVE